MADVLPARRAFLIGTSALAATGCAPKRPALVAQPDGSEILRTKKGDLPIDRDDPQQGPVVTRCVIAIFSDFECPFCAKAAAALADVRRDAPEVRVVFKHYPLRKHARARQLALFTQMLHLARGPQAFWTLHDRIFAASPTVPPDEEPFAWAAELGLTKADVDRHGPSALDRVAADMQLGNALGLDGTPYVFVNASLVDEMPTRAVLSAAVRNALAV